MQRPIRLAASVAAMATTGAIVLGAAGAPAQTGTTAAQKITGKGVGRLKVGMRFSDARAMGLVGRAKPGCELEANSRSARLASPLKGSVDLTTTTPRRIRRVSVRGGATARGVGIGDPLSAIKAAYPSAKVNKKLAAMFDFWFVRVPKSGGGRIEFTVKTAAPHAVFQIDVPRVAFCE
jgi:hypothetical protein